MPSVPSVKVPVVAESAALKVWSAVHVFAWARLKSSVVALLVPPTAIVPLGLVIVSPPPPPPPKHVARVQGYHGPSGVPVEL